MVSPTGADGLAWFLLRRDRVGGTVELGRDLSSLLGRGLRGSAVTLISDGAALVHSSLAP
jgi:hypothetical protein